MLRQVLQATAIATLGLAGVAAGESSSPPPGQLAPIHGPYAPKIDPANFGTKIDNSYLPLKPGMKIHFVGVRGKTPQTDDEVVTSRTRRILGVRATAVRDTVSEHGRAVERTDDWYPQARQASGRYTGEDSTGR